MKSTTNIRCRGCGSTNLTLLYHFQNYPLFDDIVTQEKKGSEYIDRLDIVICERCNLLQNPKDIDFAEYYNDYIYSVGTSKLVSRYMHELVEKTIAKISTSKTLKVIDIGSSDGELLGHFKRKGCQVLGFEGSQALSQTAKSKGIPNINSLFSSNSRSDLVKNSFMHPDLICLLHTFDHLPYPNSFLKEIKSIMYPESYLLIEVHSLDKMIKQNEGAIFAHEHTCYYSEITLKNILLSNGFKLVDYNYIKDENMRGASQVVLCQLDEKGEHHLTNTKTIGESTRLFIKKLKQANQSVKNYISQKSSESYKFAGFGGWGRGVGSIAQAELTEKHLSCVFDNNPNLHNCYIPSTKIPIYLPKNTYLKDINEIIVFNYAYIEEIASQVREVSDKDIKITNINSIRFSS